jgi:hypothetical protein
LVGKKKEFEGGAFPFGLWKIDEEKNSDRQGGVQTQVQVHEFGQRIIDGQK